MSDPTERPYVSRGGEKLAAALDAFGLDPSGWTCADLGSNVGGFVDCLLRGGAQRVYAVDTAYGVLAWTLRKDPRVVVRERTNAMHVVLPEPVDLVTIDVGWTPQRHILPHAAELLRPGGRIVTLVKPHYESDPKRLRKGVLDPDSAREVLTGVVTDLAGRGLQVRQVIRSPITGHAGNTEFLALV